jgi:hypothetical protein
VYTDGACSGNPGPGGWAGAVAPDGVRRASGGEPMTTNQRMELSAALEALRALSQEMAEGRPIEVVAATSLARHRSTTTAVMTKRASDTRPRQTARHLTTRMVSAMTRDICPLGPDTQHLRAGHAVSGRNGRSPAVLPSSGLSLSVLFHAAFRYLASAMQKTP